MLKRNHLDSYNVYWYGPPRHESFKKVGGLNVLSRHISDRLRKAKVATEPPTQVIQIEFRNDRTSFETYQRHAKTVWLYWVRDYRELEPLPLDADNTTVGEFSVQVAKDLQDRVRAHPEVVRNFPFDVIEEAIECFRQEGYSYTSRLSPYKKFDASPIEARFLMKSDCRVLTVTMIFYLDRKEIHRREVLKFGPGNFGTGRYTSGFDLYDNEIKLLSMDMTRDAPVIPYDELPEKVRQHLPSNEQLHAEWGIPHERKANPQ